MDKVNKTKVVILCLFLILINALYYFLYIFKFIITGRRLPMTPQEAIKYYGSRLTKYERTEIEKYSEIWYLGLSACKIHGEEGSENSGYDDDTGSYHKIPHDHISYR